MTDSNTRRLGMYLEVAPDKEEGESSHNVRCRECETPICESSKDWREHAVVSQRELSSALEEYGIWVKRRELTDKIQYIEYYCPNCAVQLRTQITVAGEDPPVDLKPDFL